VSSLPFYEYKIVAETENAGVVGYQGFELTLRNASFCKAKYLR